MEEDTEIQEITGNVYEFNLSILKDFSLKIMPDQHGIKDIAYAKISGRKKTTGYEVVGIYDEPGGVQSIKITGAPKRINKNVHQLNIYDRQGNKTVHTVIFQVARLEFVPVSLPEITGLMTTHKVKIKFVNPSLITPFFTYQFPPEFGFVNTDIENTTDSTSIVFTPRKEGKYSFKVWSFGPGNIPLGTSTLRIKINRMLNNQENEWVKNPPTANIKAVDIKDWDQ